MRHGRQANVENLLREGDRTPVGLNRELHMITRETLALLAGHGRGNEEPEEHKVGLRRREITPPSLRRQSLLPPS